MLARVLRVLTVTCVLVWAVGSAQETVKEKVPLLRVPPGARAAPGTSAEPYTNTGWAREIIHVATGIALVYVPAGSATIGSPAAEAGHVGNERQHQVTLTQGFYLGRTEVTQAQWQQVMGSNPAHYRNVGQEAPVESVAWDDCRQFCNKLGDGFRLPTEVEWEYACRAGTTGPYAGDLDTMAWYRANSRKQTHPVGQKRPNAWGLYDMHGNVWEWCQDRYGDYPDGATTDPPGASAGLPRVYRGGGVFGDAESCRSAFRGWNMPGERFAYLGFRLARAADSR